jgi:hypothetical protein
VLLLIDTVGAVLLCLTRLTAREPSSCHKSTMRTKKALSTSVGSISIPVLASQTTKRIQGGGVIGLRSYRWSTVSDPQRSEGDLDVLPCRQTRTCGRGQVVVRRLVCKNVHYVHLQSRHRSSQRIVLVAVVAAVAVVVVVVVADADAGVAVVVVVAREAVVVVVVVAGAVGDVRADDATIPAAGADAAAADVGASCWLKLRVADGGPREMEAAEED